MAANNEVSERIQQGSLLSSKQFIGCVVSCVSLYYAFQRYAIKYAPDTHPSQPTCTTKLSQTRLKSWIGKSITRINDVTFSEIREIMQLASELKNMPRESLCKLANGYVLSLLFFEASTRTRCSFECAMLRMGGRCSVMTDMSSQSSTKKGETFEDTIQTVSQYSDLMVIRHPSRGSAQRARSVSGDIPVLNAGDGDGEHPTQALLDLFAMQEAGKDGTRDIDGLTITVIGDLKYGRTVHSLIKALGKFERVTVYAVSPESLCLPEELTRGINESPSHNLKLIETNELSDEILNVSDILYVTRVQKERFSDESEYERVKDCFVIDNEVLSKCKPSMKLLHPLPRVGEIKVECDSDPRACYFEQVKCGLYVRMALISLSLGLFVR